MEKIILMVILAVFTLSACASRHGNQEDFYRLPAKESALPQSPSFLIDDVFIAPPSKALKKLVSTHAAAIASGKIKNLPGGIAVIGSASGDLNGDGFTDLAVAVQQKIKLPESEPVGANELPDDGIRRYVLVFSGNAKGRYALEHSSANMILHPDDGGMMGDPFEGIVIQDGKLVIKHYGGSSSRWAYESSFAYVDGQFRLVELYNANNSTHSYGGEETTCDFVNHTVTRRPMYWGDADILTDTPLYKGELDKNIYLFDDSVFTKFSWHASLPFLPDLGDYQFDRFTSPLPLRMQPEQVLDSIKAAYYPGLAKIGMPWTTEMRATYSKLLFYEVPDYFYRGHEGTLTYFHIDANDNDGDGKLDVITHNVIFNTPDGKSAYYTIDDATGAVTQY